MLTDDGYRQIMQHARRLAQGGRGELAQHLRDAIDLRAEVEALRADAERKRIKLENMGDAIISLRSEVALYRGESERFHGLLNSVPLPPYAITYERGWELIDMFQAAAIDAARAAQCLTNPK